MSSTDERNWSTHEEQSRASTGVLRAHLVKYAKDEKGRARWQLETRAGAKYQNVEMMNPAGFMAAPKVGDQVEAVVLDLGGDHSHLVAFPIGDSSKQYRVEEGEAAFYRPDNPKQHILWDKDGNLVINTDKKIIIRGPLHIHGDVTIKGDLNSTGVNRSAAHLPPGPDPDDVSSDSSYV